MNQIYPPLDPPTRLLMGPGPSDIHPNVLEALSKPTVGHLDPYYLEAMDGLQRMLRGLFKTKNELTFAISATGSAGMEAAVVNVIEPGDKMLVCVNGVFGGRMADVARRAGANVTIIEKPWGEIFHPADIQSAIQTANPDVVGIVMAETSTGASQGLAEISALAHDAGALLLVDAVTSLGGMDINVDQCGIDVIYSGSQKCLSCPPGLAPISFSPRAVERVANRSTPVQSWYLDVSMIANYWGENRVYHHTAPINMTYGLYEAVRLIHEEGLDSCFQRHTINHLALKAGLETLGFQYAADPQAQLPMLNAVFLPSDVEDLPMRNDLLTKFGIEIGGGLGLWKGKAWRIGIMGYGARSDNVLRLLDAIEHLFFEYGIPVEMGDGQAAANAVYHSQNP
ncbi:MAG: alanine--glyoxylate aminotransferase family protein [Planctomycetota bacterium]|nr:alanine--glyoxylate aminotransferase family protein [Planctomycetota bacterium]